tara:strand:- start:1731 stop:1952 length:222 start_codon:yes stop_codon:yes gene_type:complete
MEWTNSNLRKEQMKYTTIKWVLRNHIKNKVRALWTWEDNNFTCIYQNYSQKDRIYTAEQLLKKIEDEIQVQKV